MSTPNKTELGKDVVKPFPVPMSMDENNVYPPGAMNQRVIINPPPPDGRCYVCGKHVSELAAYGGPGDPMVGDFRGAKLLKTFLPDWIPPTEEELEELSKRIRKEEPGLTDEEYDSAMAEASHQRKVALPRLHRAR